MHHWTCYNQSFTPCRGFHECYVIHVEGGPLPIVPSIFPFVTISSNLITTYKELLVQRISLSLNTTEDQFRTHLLVWRKQQELAFQYHHSTTKVFIHSITGVQSARFGYNCSEIIPSNLIWRIPAKGHASFPSQIRDEVRLTKPALSLSDMSTDKSTFLTNWWVLGAFLVAQW